MRIKYSSFLVLILFACGTKTSKEQPEFSFRKETSSETLASSTVDLVNKGIGPVEGLELPEAIDENLAAEGKLIYQQKCYACHREDRKFIGPAPAGILKRRSPEWIMNMILNTDEMIEKDSLAKAIFLEFNGQPMTNQGLQMDEARAILEYFRNLE